MIVQCATFSKSLNSRNINKRVSDQYPVPVSKQILDIRIRLQTHYPARYPTGKPDSDHLWREYLCWRLC